MNRYTLTDEVKEKYKPILQDYIKRIEENGIENIPLEFDLSGTELNPYTLQQLLEDFGYKPGYMDSNGWQWDFWIHMRKEGYKTIILEGTGITFSLGLRESDD